MAKMSELNCNCGYPTIVAKNMCGHDLKCPVYLDWKKELEKKQTPLPGLKKDLRDLYETTFCRENCSFEESSGNLYTHCDNCCRRIVIEVSKLIYD